MRRFAECLAVLSGGYWFGVAVEAGWDWRRLFIAIPPVVAFMLAARPLSGDSGGEQ